MPPTPTAVPFLIRREHSVIRGPEITATRESSHGLLRLHGSRLIVQRSTIREVSRVGTTTTATRELGPVLEASVPLTGLAGAEVRWRVLPWPPRWQLLLRAADLQGFRTLADQAGLPLVHPTQLALELRWADRIIARHFVAELELALANAALEAAERAESAPPDGRTLSRPPKPPD